MGYWVLSRYADVAAVLRDPRFGVGMDEASVLQATLEGAPGSATVAELSRWMLFRDPPDHTRLRGLVSSAFTPRAVEALRPRVQSVVDDLIDSFRGSDEVDLIAGLALPLPVTIISELLGMPVEDQAQAREWAEAIAQVLDPVVSESQVTRADTAVRELSSYIAGVVEHRRAHPGPDLLSRLIEARDDAGERLSQAELISTVALLFGAGHETTRNLVGNGILALLRHPDQLDALRRDAAAGGGLIRGAVEELLRYDSPVQLAGRGAREDIDLAGERIRAGEPVMLLIGAANRDPARFADPDRLDVARPDLKMLSFGGGIHFCLGAMLARVEAQIAIGTLLARVPSLELTGATLEWRTHITLRGLQALPVRIGPVGARRDN
jgi:cytochrome P450